VSTRTILVVFLALICGAGMAVGVLQSNRPKAAEVVPTDTEEVLVATVDLERGTTLTEVGCRSARVAQRDGASRGPLRGRSNRAAKRVVKGQILTGELILAPKLTTEEAGVGLGSMIPHNMRAVTIMASSVASNLAGFVLPGNKVDVLLNLRGGVATTRPAAAARRRCCKRSRCWRWTSS
jgi:pilus assembly protein CpaB